MPSTVHQFHGPLSRRRLIEQAALAATGGGLSHAFAQTPTFPQSIQEVTRVAEDVYMWRSIGHNSMFIVTSEGVIATDPVGLGNPNSPQVYKAAIASVTNQPVRYLIYSHEHGDHIPGGNVFADTLESVVAHRNAAPKIAARNSRVTPLPTFLVDTQATINIGGKSIDVIYAGRNHSDNSLVVYYGERRIMFAVDFIPVRSLPFRTLDDSYLDEWIASLKWIEENIPFEILIPGHGALGTKDTVREVRQYFLDLTAAIRAARAGNLADNSPEMVTAVRNALQPRYGTWANFGPYLPENIQGVIRMWREQGGA